MNINIIPNPETLLASVSPNESRNKISEAVLRARRSTGTCGGWRKLSYAAGFFVLSLLLYAAAIFAPIGIGASIVAVLATAALVAAIYYSLEFDPSALKQIVLLFEHTVDKSVLISADAESRQLGDDQLAAVLASVHQQAIEALASDGGLAEIKTLHADALEVIRSHQQGIEPILTGARGVVESADAEVRKASAAFERRTRQWWPSRLVPVATRTPAQQWISAVEKHSRAKLHQIACAQAKEVYENLALAMSQGSEEYAKAMAEVGNAGTEARMQTNGIRQLRNLTGCDKNFPLPDEIEEIVENQVACQESAIRHTIASRPAGQSIADAIRFQAESIAASLPFPQTFAAFYAQRNGDKQILLKQIDLQSKEFSIADKKPGSQPIRHRFLLAQGGETSPVCKDVARISRGMLVRAIDHPRADEFVSVTESRFEPCSEITEYLEGVRQFQSLTPEKRAAMVVEVDDDAELISYTPELSHDPSRPERLLFVALTLGIIKRTGAECYKLVDENDPDKTPFAKGLQQALDAMTTNETLARDVERAIEGIYSAEGVEAIAKKLLDAKAKNPVPSAATKRFRESLSQELQRLDSARPALAV